MIKFHFTVFVFVTALTLAACGKGNQQNSPSDDSDTETRSSPTTPDPADDPDRTEQSWELNTESILQLLKLPQLSQEHMQILERALFNAFNSYRLSLGLDKLDYDERVALLARKHSQRMERVEVPVGHAFSDLRFRAINKFLKYVDAGENVAYNYNVPNPLQMALWQWQQSPEHKKLLLLSWNEGGKGVTGIGIARGRASKKYYFTQIFVKARQ